LQEAATWRNRHIKLITIAVAGHHPPPPSIPQSFSLAAKMVETKAKRSGFKRFADRLAVEEQEPGLTTTQLMVRMTPCSHPFKTRSSS